MESLKGLQIDENQRTIQGLNMPPLLFLNRMDQETNINGLGDEHKMGETC